MLTYFIKRFFDIEPIQPLQQQTQFSQHQRFLVLYHLQG